MLNIKDALAAHAECDRKVILTEMFFFAYFRDIVCYHIAPSILIISGNHFREIVLSWERRKTGLRHSLYYILYVVPETGLSAYYFSKNLKTIIFCDLDWIIFLIQGDKEGSCSVTIQLFTVGIAVEIEDTDLP